MGSIWPTQPFIPGFLQLFSFQGMFGVMSYFNEQLPGHKPNSTESCKLVETQNLNASDKKKEGF